MVSHTIKSRRYQTGHSLAYSTSHGVRIAVKVLDYRREHSKSDAGMLRQHSLQIRIVDKVL